MIEPTSNNISYCLTAAIFVIYTIFLSNSMVNSCENHIKNILSPLCNFGFNNSDLIFVISMIVLVIGLRIYFAEKEKGTRIKMISRINQYIINQNNTNNKD